MDQDVLQLMKDAVTRGASDVFLVAGLPVVFKIKGQQIRIDDNRLDADSTERYVESIYRLANDRDMTRIRETGDDDFSFAVGGVSRFRVNIYRQRGSYAAVIRIITFDLPDPDTIGIPKVVMDMADYNRGLVLVTGSAGSGKSTTLACIIDRINQTHCDHIITLEDPLEYLHRHRSSIVSQREIPTDSESYAHALRASLRQAPDVILLGEMRDHETINIAMTAAETGHLVFSTLHTVGAAKTIDRVIDAFPPNQQNQIRVQLAMVLQAVVSQQLIPTVDGTVIPAFEIMIANSAIRTMIRESKVHQIDTVIQSSSRDGMLTMDNSLFDLYLQKLITDKTAMTFCTNPDTMAKRLKP